MDLVPQWLLGWFWLFGAAVMVVNAALIYARAAPLERVGRVTPDERRRFALGLAGWSAGFCLAVQVIVWATGESRPECLAAFPPGTPASLATTALTLAGWAVLLLWLWRGRGGETLSKFAPAVAPRPAAGPPRDPMRVRRLATGFVILAAVGSVVASRVAPAPADCRGGSAPSAAGSGTP
ncbi:MAG TPA: hypothetical protein VFM14_13680 [Gemmatimonadales bacterium]|nr:hypothetical protein [Gemmatimonadales bacterium]